MALSHTKLANPQQLPSSVGSLYANPASTKTFVRGFLLHNTNTTTETVDIHMVPDAAGALGTPAASNRLFRLSVLAGETVTVDFKFPIMLTDENDGIFGVTTTASKVTFVPLGDQLSTVFTPPTLNLLFQYSAAAAYTDAGATTLCSVNGVDTCYVLKDLSGNNYDLVQPTGGVRPLWIANAANGLPGLRWPSTTAGATMLTSSFARGAAETIYVVTKAISCTNGSNLYDGVTNNSRGARIRNSGSDCKYELYAGGSVVNSVDTIAPFGAFVVHTTLWNTVANATLQINHQSALIGNPGTNSASGFSLGAVAGDNASFEIIEIYGYSGNHDSTTIANMQAYLAARSAISL